MRIAHTLSAILAAAAVATVADAQQAAFTQPPYVVVATGLNAPRGLTFGPDGALYIAEAGKGGSTATKPGTGPGQCAQVPGPVGPYTGGNTAQISKVAGGKLQPVATGFASTVDHTGDLIGVADVAFLNGQLYALVAGGGCSHGNNSYPNGVAAVDTKTGKWGLVANMSTYLHQVQTEFENAGDFEPDGTAYSMIPYQGELVVVEPNHGEILSVNPSSGHIARLMDVSASEGHIVPTSIAALDDSFYVGNLSLFPIVQQTAKILTVALQDKDDQLAPGFNSPFYHVVNSKIGLTTVVAVHFGPDGLLYALELNDAAGFPGPMPNGKVVRINRAGNIETVVDVGILTAPGGMTFGPDGALYVSDNSAVPAPAFGVGRILKFSITPG